jgi:hypothetical protein
VFGKVRAASRRARERRRKRLADKAQYRGKAQRRKFLSDHDQTGGLA